MLFKDATPEDIQHVKENLRQVDIDSFMETSQTDDVATCFDHSHQLSERIFAVIDNGECIGIAGICKDPFHENHGFPWFIGTPAVEKKVRGFIKITKAIHQHYYQADNWDGLVTYVDSINVKSFKWMTKWLGFTHTRDIDNFSMARRVFHEVIHTRKKYEEDLKNGKVWLDAKGKELWNL